MGMGQPLPQGPVSPRSGGQSPPLGLPGNQTPTSPDQHSPPARGDGGHFPAPSHQGSYLPLQALLTTELTPTLEALTLIRQEEICWRLVAGEFKWWTLST